jgi:hypothetical protein
MVGYRYLHDQVIRRKAGSQHTLRILECSNLTLISRAEREH